MSVAIYQSECVSFDAFQTNGVSGRTKFQANVNQYNTGSIQLNLAVQGACVVVYPTADDLEKLGRMLVDSADAIRNNLERESSMKTREELEAELPNFIGTDHYTRYSPLFPNVLLTDGALFLAKNAGAFWLMDLISSHLSKVPADEGFVVVAIESDPQGSASTRGVHLVDDIPANHVYATQCVLHTDFPFDAFKLYVARDGDCWVIMLPSEY